MESVIGKVVASVDVKKTTNLIAFQVGWRIKEDENVEISTRASYTLFKDRVPIGRLLTGPTANWQEYEFHGVLVGPGKLELVGELIAGPNRLEGKITMGAEA